MKKFWEHFFIIWKMCSLISQISFDDQQSVFSSHLLLVARYPADEVAATFDNRNCLQLARLAPTHSEVCCRRRGQVVRSAQETLENWAWKWTTPPKTKAMALQKPGYRVNNKMWRRGMAGNWQRKTSSLSSHDPRSSPALASAHIPCHPAAVSFRMRKAFGRLDRGGEIPSGQVTRELGQRLSYCQFVGPNWSNYCSARGVGADF